MRFQRVAKRRKRRRVAKLRPKRYVLSPLPPRLSPLSCVSTVHIKGLALMTPRRRLNRKTLNRAGKAGVMQTVAIFGVALIGIALARTSAPAARLADPTFAKDVAPILYKNCTTCHRPGGMGPFTLLEYDTAKTKLDEMYDAVKGGVMPPWHAEGAHGVFSN